MPNFLAPHICTWEPCNCGYQTVQNIIQDFKTLQYQLKQYNNVPYWMKSEMTKLDKEIKKLKELYE